MTRGDMRAEECCEMGRMRATGEYKYIHKCQSLVKVEKMTTIGEIGRIDAADAVIQCWKTSSITQL